MLIAPPLVPGELRKKLHDEASAKVVGEIPKTLTNHAVFDIEKTAARRLARFPRNCLIGQLARRNRGRRGLDRHPLIRTLTPRFEISRRKAAEDQQNGPAGLRTHRHASTMM